ncbi:MAG TPA: 3'-5' exonuclease [Gemmatimonadales bacterium]|jgi:DNA polymerase-3 subunit epsilon|nr:3'-5' exonuclease [Gemmatimonadales bacterium]
MNGLTAHPAGTLVDRALELLQSGPASAEALATRILGLPNAPVAVAERLALALLGADPRVRQQPDGRWAMVAAAQGSPMLDECVFAVVDVETTGMQASGADRITEIAVVLVHGLRREVVFESLVNPGRDIPHRICELTGITSAMVANAPTFAEIADQVTAALAGRVFVAHNARFDWTFVTAEVRRNRDLALDGPRLCTVRLARRLIRDEPSYSLGALAARLGYEFSARHRAAGDALVTGMLLQRLLADAREQGAITLADLETLHRSPIRGAAA